MIKEHSSKNYKNLDVLPMTYVSGICDETRVATCHTENFEKWLQKKYPKINKKYVQLCTYKNFIGWAKRSFFRFVIFNETVVFSELVFSAART